MDFTTLLEWILAVLGGTLLSVWIVRVVRIAEEVREFYKSKNPDSFIWFTE